MKRTSLVPVKQTSLMRRPNGSGAQAKRIPPPPPLRLRHYKHVYWMTGNGPMVTAYRAVVFHDGCSGCLVCGGTTDWFMAFARVAKKLLGINLRDCLHWGPLHDSPRPLIAPASNLGICNQGTLERLRAAYYRLPERERPRIEAAPASLPNLTQAQRFEGSIAILGRMIELWEDGQYIGWPS
jgi:hypothetical protein